MSGNSPQGGGPVKAYGSSGVAAVRLGNTLVIFRDLTPYLSLGGRTSVRIKGCQTIEKRLDVCQECPNPVYDDPAKPDPFEPIPCLVGFMLIIGHLGSDNGDRRHQSGQYSADACNFCVDILDDAVCGLLRIV